MQEAKRHLEPELENVKSRLQQALWPPTPRPPLCAREPSLILTSLQLEGELAASRADLQTEREKHHDPLPETEEQVHASGRAYLVNITVSAHTHPRANTSPLP